MLINTEGNIRRFTRQCLENVTSVAQNMFAKYIAYYPSICFSDLKMGIFQGFPLTRIFCSHHSYCTHQCALVSDNTGSVVLRNIEGRSRNHCGRETAIRITQSECVPVAFTIQHAMRMRLIILPSMTCPAVPYFSTLSHAQHHFRGKKLSYMKCVFTFCTFIRNISLSKKN